MLEFCLKITIFLNFSGVLSPMVNSNNETTTADCGNPMDNLRFSSHTLDKATKAKVTLENYYSNLILQHRERKIR